MLSVLLYGWIILNQIGIVGINGTGKSTLLKMAAGLEKPDTGQIIRQNNLKIAYLPQDPEFPEGATILSYIQDCEAQWRAESNLTRLGIQEYATRIAHLSGGQKRKVALAKVLASERKRQSVLRMELEWAKRGCRARSTKQRARLERLAALKNGAVPVRDQTVELDQVETRMGKKTMELQEARLEEKMERWVYLQELAEKIEGQK